VKNVKSTILLLLSFLLLTVITVTAGSDTMLGVTSVVPDKEPEITWGPNDCSVPENKTARFYIDATGHPMPDHLWQISYDNGSSWIDIAYAEQIITGAEMMTTILTLENIALTDNGNQYRCILSNSEGSITSGSVTLTVTTGPSAFASVTYISEVPRVFRVDEPVKLTGTITPDFATNKIITWSIKDPYGTDAQIDGDILSSITPGRVLVTALVSGGIDSTTDFTKDFLLYINNSRTPYIIGPDSWELLVGYEATTIGRFISRADPRPVVTISSSDPRITWNSDSEVLEIARGLKAGSYTVEFTSSNGDGPDATHTFVLTVIGSGTQSLYPQLLLIAIIAVFVLAAIAVVIIVIIRKKKDVNKSSEKVK